MLSEMFVSESIKERIVMSASLGKISEVRSELEVSEWENGGLMGTGRERNLGYYRS